jgi:ABC-type sugar transport system ATPase subunit
MNLVRTTVDKDDLVFGQHRLPIHPTHRNLIGDRKAVIVGIRPESLKDPAHADPALPTLSAEISALEDLGTESHAFFTVQAPPIQTGAASTGGEDDLFVGPDQVRFVARLPSSTSVEIGATVPLAVDVGNCHFFDADDHTSLRSTAAPAAPDAPTR